MRHVLICAVVLLTSTGLFAQADRSALVDEVVTVLDREMNREVLVWMASTIAIREISSAGVKETETSDSDAAVVFQKFFHSPEFASVVLRPWVEETFTTAELQEIAKMVRTPAGQKLISALTRSHGTLMERAAGHLRPQLTDALLGPRAEEMRRLAKIKRTAADMRTLATASEAYAIDNKGFPPARDLDELERFLSPTYVKRMPRLDAWGNPLQYIVSQDRTHYRILSGGADGIIEPRHQHIEQATSSIQLETGDDASADLVFQDGRFAVLPASLETTVAQRVVEHRPIPPGYKRVGGDVRAPQVIRRVEPVYPDEARAARISGVVIVETMIDAAGDVVNVVVLKPLPYGLDQAAVDAVRQWKFQPATENGVPVPVVFTLTMNFKLE